MVTGQAPFTLKICMIIRGSVVSLSFIFPPSVGGLKKKKKVRHQCICYWRNRLWRRRSTHTWPVKHNAIFRVLRREQKTGHLPRGALKIRKKRGPPAVFPSVLVFNLLSNNGRVNTKVKLATHEQLSRVHSKTFEGHKGSAVVPMNHNANKRNNQDNYIKSNTKNTTNQHQKGNNTTKDHKKNTHTETSTKTIPKTTTTTTTTTTPTPPPQNPQLAYPTVWCCPFANVTSGKQKR